jgi:endonuclease YncB( thermonuclease family)
MKMKYLISILALFLLAAGLGGYAQSQDIKLRNQVAGLQEQVITLETQNETLETQKENLSVEIRELKSEIAALKEVIDNLKDFFFPLNTFGTQATVVRVIDGDTIEVDIDGTICKVRYIGIDAPELGDERPEFSTLAQEAARVNKQLVEGEIVWLEKDISETDLYGRLLRYVYIDDTFVNAELVRQGLAWAKAYEPDTKYWDYLEELEAEARQAGRGIWALPEG